MPRSHLERLTGNYLLDRVPPVERGRLVEASKLVSFNVRDEVDGLRWDEQPVFFPISGVFSLLLTMKDGSFVEVAVVDSEGMLGIPIVLGMNEDPVRAVAQVAGQCIRVPQDRFLQMLHDSKPLDALVRRFIAVSWQTANQTIACNLRHTVKERTCRWLLSVHDRATSDELPVTHEILSGMVGASRQKVTSVMGELQNAELVTLRRSRVRIEDRAGLEQHACECYRVLRKARTFLTS
jgi:CRP-like cAMP-binding protein